MLAFDYCFLPADERWLAGHNIFLPFFLRSLSTLRPVGLAMRVRKPDVRRRALTYKGSQRFNVTICLMPVVISEILIQDAHQP